MMLGLVRDEMVTANAMKTTQVKMNVPVLIGFRVARWE